MDFLTIMFIAVGLSMDSFAVSLSNGLTIKNLNAKRVLTFSLSLAFFQAAMPLIGWLAGLSIEEYIKEIDHWVAFILLALIGAKMVIEGVRKNGGEGDMELKIITLISQSFATSIDAFAVGISFALLKQSDVLSQDFAVFLNSNSQKSCKENVKVHFLFRLSVQSLLDYIRSRFLQIIS